MGSLVSRTGIENRIFLIRGFRVMLDRDLAELYGVSTKALNQAVKRNVERFPAEFMFRLTEQERAEVVTNCDHLQALKFSRHLPLVFTEYGVVMLASVLNSPRAINVNVQIIRTFVRLREMMVAHKGLSEKLARLERRVGHHDFKIREVFAAIRRLVSPSEKHRPTIGFKP